MRSSASRGGRAKVAVGAAIAVVLITGAFALRARNELSPMIGPEAQHLLVELLLFLVLGSFVITLAVAWTTSSLVVAPLEDLTRAAHGMRHDLGIRSGVRGLDEVGQLGEALDSLVDWVHTEKRSLEEDRDRLAAILESMAEGVLVTDAEGAIVLTNAAFREMLLLDRTILGRRPIEVLRVAGLDDVLAKVVASAEGAAQELELAGLRPRRVLVRARPLRSRITKESPGIVLVFTDVTEVRRLESMRRDFVANVSHELRTPIAAIRAASETIADAAANDAATVKDFGAIITRNAARLQNLVEDLLELSKIEAREWKLDLAPLGMREAAQAAIETVAAAARDRGTILRNEVSADVVARADRRAIDQILLNLLDNAVKYAGAKAKITVSAKRVDDRVHLRVADDGPGIEPRHHARLFERFYRVDTGRSRAVGGTGLGLSIVKHLVEAMGSAISVESQVGRGTTFDVSLPAITDDGEGEKESPAHRAAE